MFCGSFTQPYTLELEGLSVSLNHSYFMNFKTGQEWLLQKYCSPVVNDVLAQWLALGKIQMDNFKILTKTTVTFKNHWFCIL